MAPEYEAFLDGVRRDPDAIHAPTPEADRHWHEHLLDTRSYRAMCDERFGGRFLHHVPAGNGNPYCAAQLGD